MTLCAFLINDKIDYLFKLNLLGPYIKFAESVAILFKNLEIVFTNPRTQYLLDLLFVQPIIYIGKYLDTLLAFIVSFVMNDSIRFWLITWVFNPIGTLYVDLYSSVLSTVYSMIAMAQNLIV